MDDVTPAGTFVRSMATRGHQGGLALAVPGAVRVLDAAGFSTVVIETVGVGQVEVDVVAAADTAVVITTPGTGDAVQANKAGLLEVADLFVVNKADRPGADDARRDLELMLDLARMTGADTDEAGNRFRPDIIMAIATSGEGASAIASAIDAHLEHLRVSGNLEPRRAQRVTAEIRSRAEQVVLGRLTTLIAGPEAQAMMRASIADDSSPVSAAESIVELLTGEIK